MCETKKFNIRERIQFEPEIVKKKSPVALRKKKNRSMSVSI